MSTGLVLTPIPRNIRALYVDLASTAVLQPDAWIQGSGYAEMANGVDLWVARSLGVTMQARAFIYVIDHAIDALGQKNQNNGWAFPFALLYAKPQQSWFVIDGKARDAIVYGIKDIEVFARKNKFSFAIVPITGGRGAKVQDIAVKVKGPNFVSLTKLGITDMTFFEGLPTDVYEPPTADNGIPDLLAAVDSPFTLPGLRQVVTYRESISSYLNAEKKEFGRTMPGFYADELEALWFFRGAMLPILMIRRGASAASLPSSVPTSGGVLSQFGARVPFQIPPRVSPRAQGGVDHAFGQGYEYARNVLIQNNGTLNGWKRR